LLANFFIAIYILLIRWWFGSVGSIVGHINEVNQHQARLVLGWVNVGQLSLAIPLWVGAWVPVKAGM